MNVGDLVRTIEGWSYKTWTGIIIGMEASEDWDGETLYNEEELLRINPMLAGAKEIDG